MYYIFIALLLHLGACTEGTGNKFGLLSQGVQTGVSAVADAVQVTLEKTPIVGEKVFSECVEPPLECPNENITFWYYSRRNPDVPRQILVTKPETLNLERNRNPWKVIIHGYTNSKDKIPNPELRSAYLKRGEYNLISVDYEPLARDKCYIQAVHNVPLISKCTAQMIDALMDRNLFGPDDLHLVGFSLGGQISGQVHEFLRHDKPRRVTGLDPASPLFDGILNNKLSKDSGKFVDVIHTNGLAAGKLELAGHADFYVNGGLNQPGCLTNNNGSINSCSHRRGPLYFAESINSPEGFWAVPCSDSVKFYTGLCKKDSSSEIPMGEDTPETARGTYFLKTSDKAPFALGKSNKSDKSGNSEKSDNSKKSGSSEKTENSRRPGNSDKSENSRKPGNSGNFENSGRPGNSENFGNSENSRRPGNSGNFENSGNSENSRRPGNSGHFENSGNSENSRRPENSGHFENSERTENSRRPGNSGNFENSGNSENSRRPGNSGFFENSGKSENSRRPGNSGNFGNSRRPGNSGNFENSERTENSRRPGSSGNFENSRRPGNSGNFENSGRSGNSERFENSERSGNSGRHENSGRSGNSERFENSGRHENSGRPGNSERFENSGRSGNSERSENSERSGNSRNFENSGRSEYSGNSGKVRD